LTCLKSSSQLRNINDDSGSVCILLSICLQFHRRSLHSISIEIGSVLFIVVTHVIVKVDFVSLFLFQGFRFLRAIRIMNTPDILQYMGLIERPRTIRIVQLASRFIAVWFAAAGAVHLAENSGDFFCNFENAQELDVFNAIYFMIVTMTTVMNRS
jgi:hypothetical protein